MKKIYILVQDHDYEGYSQPYGAWLYYPTKQEIYDFLAPQYLSTQRSWNFKTLEETRAYDSENLWKAINSGKWVIEECELVC
jgi:hypothetical protein